MLELPYAIYLAFNEVLISVIRQKVGDTECKLPLTLLWKQFAGTSDGKELLRGVQPLHMRRKLENKKAGDTISIKRELLVGCMQLIHETRPDLLPAPDVNTKGLLFSKQAKYWGAVFLSKYFPDKPELIRYFLPDDEADDVLDNQEAYLAPVHSFEKDAPGRMQFNGELFKKTADERLRTLDKSFFTIDYMQGDMRDYGSISFRVKYPNIICGEYVIFYQQKDGTYPYKPEILSIQGLLLGLDIIVLTLINNNIMRTHVCTMQLFYDANFDLKGHYIVDYREGVHKGIPEERKGVKTGEMSFTRATQEEAGTYLEKMMKGKKRRNEYYNYKGTDAGNNSDTR